MIIHFKTMPSNIRFLQTGFLLREKEEVTHRYWQPGIFPGIFTITRQRFFFPVIKCILLPKQLHQSYTLRKKMNSGHQKAITNTLENLCYYIKRNLGRNFLQPQLNYYNSFVVLFHKWLSFKIPKLVSYHSKLFRSKLTISTSNSPNKI